MENNGRVIMCSVMQDAGPGFTTCSHACQEHMSRLRCNNGNYAVHTLYRYWDGPILLYIGRSNSFYSRSSAHKAQKWMPDADHVTLEHFYDSDCLKAAEVSAIREERPMWNIIHNG